MGDHETGIEAGLRHQKAGRPLMRESVSRRDSPFRERANLGDGDGDAVGGERHGLGMKVSARDDFTGIGKDQRIVGDCIDLALDDA